ncbi:hypothetical protein BGW37DRAFT_485867 [Umbelopsis sp. PMI_123]|nr:hypothetical protein BGW37DRAFT_485867 [Umbelopsis sp. PMI_123]
MSTLPITTSEVAGIISASVTFMSFTSSLAIVAILLAVISNKTTANGWSVAGAAIQSSPWPYLLRTDSSRSLGVQNAIQLMSNLALAGTCLMSLTGIITPMGLQDITILKSAQSQTLSYIPDSGPMGLATTPRTKYKEGRLCAGWPNVACVGSALQVNNGTSTVFTEIYANITSKFTSPSGTQSSLNMQYRQYTTQIQSGVNNNQPTSVGHLTNLKSFILSNSTTAAEGVVIDMTNTPGIGILQHSFPTDSDGSSWFRDVLWLEPITECVNTNLTIQYKISSDFVTPVVNSTILVDKGGIFNLTTQQPSPYNDTINNIDLRYHAYTGAVWGNLATLRAANTSRNASHYGSTYPLRPPATNSIGYLSFLPIDYLAQMASGNMTDAYFVPSTGYVQSYCQGYNQDSTFNATTRMIHCSLLLGTPYSTSGSNNIVLQTNETFEQPVYSCASTVQASIQRLNITMNQQITNTTSYSGLQISRQSTNTSILWGIESTGMNVSSGNAYWGPVSNSYADDPGLYTQQSETLLLPVGRADFPFSLAGFVTVDPVDTQGSSLPGQIFTLMENLWSLSSSSAINAFDFTGKNDYGMLTLWQELSKTADTAPQIVQYIWTNLMANNALGVGDFTTANVSPKGTGVSYDFRYAIPAFITLAFWLVFICFALILLFKRQVTLNEVRNAINQTSIGRAVVNMINPTSRSLEKTKKWAEVEGNSTIGLVMGHTTEGDMTAKFDYEPKDISFNKILASIPRATSSESSPRLRARKPSTAQFTPLEDSDITAPVSLQRTHTKSRDNKPNVF